MDKLSRFSDEIESGFSGIIFLGKQYVFLQFSTLGRDGIEMKASAGTVVVQNFQGRLRLVWSCGGKRYFFTLGLPEGKTNRLVAERKARWIEGDIATGNFDRSLDKYRPEGNNRDRQQVCELFEKFTDSRKPNLKKHTLNRYRALATHLNKVFGGRIANQIIEQDAIKFKDYCFETRGIKEITFRDYLSLVNACWEWAIKKGWLTENPWQHVKVRVPPKQKPKPFTGSEIQKILKGFRNSTSYSFYADYVEFIFLVGCRLGEAAALRWKHVRDDCSSIWIGESVNRGDFDTEKRNRDRTVHLNDRAKSLLQERKRQVGLAGEEIDDYFVFPAPKGGAIDNHNFRNRAWESTLEEAKVKYRRPNAMRSTAISHMLQSRLSPLQVSAIVGTSVRVIYQHYAGDISESLKLPDLYEHYLGNVSEATKP